MIFPRISLRRTLLIAQRDFYGYVKTWGFWISFCLPFVFGLLGFLFTIMDFNISLSPVRYEAILDETGKYETEIIAAREAGQKDIALELLDELGTRFLSKEDADILKTRIETDGMAAARDYLAEKHPGIEDKLPEDKTRIVPAPANNIDALKPYILGDKTFIHAGEDVKLNGVLHIYNDGELKVNYWSENFQNPLMRNIARVYFRDRASQAYLESGGLTLEGLTSARRGVVEVDIFDPSKTASGGENDQEVNNTDRIPYFAAFAMAMILWLTVFSGSYMLLTSMLEEKTNKLLEMMLASCRISEVMFGKLIGVAALTITAMLPYIILGVAVVIGGILFGSDGVRAGLIEAFPPKMIVFFTLYLILGYVFYGSLFIGLGALSESMQDAQTLTTPIMLVLTACVLIIPVGLNAPDSPLLAIATWVPISAPFAAIVTLPSDPPLWKLCLSAFFLFLCSVGLVWLSGRILKFGVLSGASAKVVKDWFMRTVLRRKQESS